MLISQIKPGVPNQRAKESGMVLVITLVLLFVMTLVMISSMRANISEERMAGNSRDWNTAFQAAEAALRDGERDLLYSGPDRLSGASAFETGCSSTGLCDVSITGTPIWTTLLSTDPGWTQGANSGTKTVKYGTFDKIAVDPIADVAAQPRYIIEQIPVTTGFSLKAGFVSKESDANVYRITAVGFGANITSRVVLQSVYRK